MVLVDDCCCGCMGDIYDDKPDEDEGCRGGMKVFIAEDDDDDGGFVDQPLDVCCCCGTDEVEKEML